MHLLPLPRDYWYTYFFLAGPGSLHKIAVSAFSRSPLGRANTFSFLFLLLTPRKSLKCSSSFTLFLRVRSLSLVSVLSFPSVLYSPNFSMNSISSWFPPISFHTFSTTLSHLIPALALLSRWSIQPYLLSLATFFAACCLLYVAISTFSRLLLVSSGYIPSPALNTVLPVVLEHPNTFLAAANVYCFQLFYQPRVPFPYLPCMF